MTEEEPRDQREGKPGSDIVTVTWADFAETDLEAPIRGTSKVDCWSLADLYQTAYTQHERSGNEVAARVFRPCR